MNFILTTLSFLLGIIWLQNQEKLPDLSLGILCILLILLINLLLFIQKKIYLQRIILLVAGFIFGFYYAAWRGEIRLNSQLKHQLEGENVVVSGVVSSLPFKLHGFTSGIAFTFNLEQKTYQGKKLPEKINVSWYSKQALPTIIPGQKWLLTLRLKRVHSLSNPNGFDFEYYALQNDIQALGTVRHSKNFTLNEINDFDFVNEEYLDTENLANTQQNPRLISENTAGIFDFKIWRERLRYALKNNLENTLDEKKYPYVGIIAALTYGEQKAMTNQLWLTFRQSGVSHLFSVSGLHVTMFAWLSGWIIGFFWRRTRLTLIFPTPYAIICAGAAVAYAYAHISGMGIPAERTVIMLITASIYQLCGRNSSPSQIIFLALLVVLLFDPWAVMAAGFWLSFIAVSALVFVQSSSFNLNQQDIEYHQIKQQKNFFMLIKEKLKNFLSTQWVATLATLPIILYLFQSFPIVSFLANLLAIPFISLLITPATLIAICLPQLPLLEICHYLLDFFMIFINWCAKWPQISIAKPPLFSLLFAAFGVILLLFPKGFPLRIFAIFFILPLFFSDAKKLAYGEFETTIFDVGQGLAIVIKTSEGIVLFDSGPRFGQDSAAERVLLPWFKANAINQIDTLIISHNDLDHHGGSKTILENYPIKSIYSSLLDFPGKKCQAGQNFSLGGINFLFIHPTNPITNNLDIKDNHLSCVLKIKSNSYSMLITADIEKEDEEQLFSYQSDLLASDILIVPHHGSKTSSTNEFLTAVKAKEAIISAGYKNRFGHPHQDVMTRLAINSRIWRTDRDGAIFIKSDFQQYQINSWRNIYRRYWM